MQISSILPGNSGNDPKAAAQKVQAMFLEVMLKSMEESVSAEDGLFGGSSSAEIYRSMFRQELADAISTQLGGSLTEELEKAAAPKPATTQPTPTDAKPRAHVEGLDRELPVDGTVTSTVGWRSDPISGERRYHRGTDIAAPQGSPVFAVASGVVTDSRAIGGYGNAVVIQADDGRKMLYGHNLRNLVRPGDRVEAGAPIAQVGSSGRATGPHVHFEILEQ